MKTAPLERPDEHKQKSKQAPSSHSSMLKQDYDTSLFVVLMSALLISNRTPFVRVGKTVKTAGKHAPD